MQFAAHRSDLQRVSTAMQANQSLDVDPPAQPEHLNWQLRQRHKSLEIGPNMRFKSHLQIERLVDQLQTQTGSFYS